MGKRPLTKEQATGGKTAFAIPAPDWRDQHPVWRFGLMDIEHEEWGWHSLPRNCWQAVHARLKEYERKTWKEILAMRGGKGPFNGLIQLEDLQAKNARAVERLRERRLDSAGAVMKLRYDGQGRLYGVMEGRVCSLVWCDQDHGVWSDE